MKFMLDHGVIPPISSNDNANGGKLKYKSYKRNKK